MSTKRVRIKLGQSVSFKTPRGVEMTGVVAGYYTGILTINTPDGGRYHVYDVDVKKLSPSTTPNEASK